MSTDIVHWQYINTMYNLYKKNLTKKMITFILNKQMYEIPVVRSFNTYFSDAVPEKRTKSKEPAVILYPLLSNTEFFFFYGGGRGTDDYRPCLSGSIIIHIIYSRVFD